MHRFFLTLFLVNASFINPTFAKSVDSSESFEEEIAKKAAASIKGYKTVGEFIETLNPKDQRDKKSLELALEKFGKTNMPEVKSIGNKIIFGNENESIELELVRSMERKYKLNGYEFQANRHSSLYDQVNFFKRVLKSNKPKSTADVGIDSLFIQKAHAILFLGIPLYGWITMGGVATVGAVTYSHAASAPTTKDVIEFKKIFTENFGDKSHITAVSCATREIDFTSADGKSHSGHINTTINSIDSKKQATIRSGFQKCCAMGDVCENFLTGHFSNNPKTRESAKSTMENMRPNGSAK